MVKVMNLNVTVTNSSRWSGLISHCNYLYESLSEERHPAKTAPMLQSSTHLTGEHTWVITGEHIWVITGDWAHQSHHRWFSTPELSQVSTHESSQVIEHTWVITADWEHLSHHRWAHPSPHRWLSTPGSSQVSTPESWNRGMHNCKFKTKPHCHMI